VPTQSRTIMDHADSAWRTLLSLQASGLNGSVVRWERLLAINYTALVGRGSNIIDVGGKKGRHVAMFLDNLRAERVYAFEPNPAMADILRRRFAGRRNLTIIEMALADHAGTEEFVINLGAPGESGLRQRAYSDPDRPRIERITVPVGRLDDQTFEGPIHYVKIDVEGGEIGVLQGGRDFLTRHKPFVSVEYGAATYSAYGHTANTLYEEAAMLGYAVCDLFGNAFRSIDEWRACVDRLYWDYWMIPRERLQSTAGARADRASSACRAASAGQAADSCPSPALARPSNRPAAQASCLILGRTPWSRHDHDCTDASRTSGRSLRSFVPRRR
jgi:FkbM family methyltransferase